MTTTADDTTTAADGVTTTMAKALNTALRDALDADERVLVFGEDVGRLGGVFRVTDGLTAAYGERRCFDTPVAEAGIAGLAVGLAMSGFRPVVEMQFDAFAYPAFEQIASHIAKFRNRTRGSLPLPIVLRIPYGGGIGGVEHHSDSSEAYYAHTAGLKVVTPATVSDAYSLLREAIDDPDPVVFLEPKRHYWTKAEVQFPCAEGPFGAAAIRRPGADVTVVAYGPSVAVALEAAEAAAGEGVDVEVLDLRTLVPLDDHALTESVRRTGRCLVVHESQGFAGVGAEIAARVQERCFDALRGPVLRVTGLDIPYPPPLLEGVYQPVEGRVLPGVRRLMAGVAVRSAGVGGALAAGSVGEGVDTAARGAVAGERRPVAAGASRTFQLPDLGEGLAEAEVVEWKVAVGDVVSYDQTVAEVETAKSLVSLPSPYAGTVTELHCRAGESLAVGEALVTVREEVAGGRGELGQPAGVRPESGQRTEACEESGARNPGAGQLSEVRTELKAPSPESAPADSGAVLTGYGTAGPRRASLPDSPSTPHRSPLDKATAAKFLRVQRDIPAVTIWADADATNLLAARETHGTGLLPLLARACLAALEEFPALNSRVDAERGELIRHPHVNLGFAAQSDDGLAVPVVRDADRLPLDGLAAELRRLTGLARRGALTAEHLTGGTFTLNNYGPLDVDGATPLLNHPQTAMIGAARIVERPWVVDGRVEVRPVINLSLTFDHRVCDGGTAAGFLRRVIEEATG